MTEDPLDIVLLLPGKPGRLDEKRIHVRYPDGCQTHFAEGHEPTIREVLASHANLHSIPGLARDE
jgi:hypothetical protein